MAVSTEIPITGRLQAWMDTERKGRMKGYGLIAIVSIGTILLAREGPLEIVIGGAATSAVFLYGFSMFNPRYVGVELILLTILGYLTLPTAPVYWMMGSALGGGMGAILVLRGAEEDDHFFIPPMVAALFTFLLFSIGQNGGWEESLAIIGRYIETYRAAFDAMLALPENVEISKQFTSMSSWNQLHARVGLVAVSTLLGLWVVVLWLMNRFARRRTGQIQGVFNSLLLFRIRPIYTFLLIAGLIFEILATWFGRESLRYISYPLFAVCAAAFLMVHVGVVFFMAALRRAAAGGKASLAGSVLLLLALMLSLYVGPFIGLADVWFDFRKTKLIRERLM